MQLETDPKGSHFGYLSVSAFSWDKRNKKVNCCGFFETFRFHKRVILNLQRTVKFPIARTTGQERFKPDTGRTKQYPYPYQ